MTLFLTLDNLVVLWEIEALQGHPNKVGKPTNNENKNAMNQKVHKIQWTSRISQAKDRHQYECQPKSRIAKQPHCNEIHVPVSRAPNENGEQEGEHEVNLQKKKEIREEKEPRRGVAYYKHSAENDNRLPQRPRVHV